MGSLFEDTGGVTGILGTAADPAGVLTGTGLAGGQFGETGQLLADPLDLFGIRAGQTQDEISGILTQSAQEGIDFQREQIEALEALNQPFREAALGTALPGLRASAFGGETDFTPSNLFRQQLDQGQRGITGQQAATGSLKSSKTQERLSDLVSGLISEDVGRQEAGNLALLQAGIGSEEALRQSGQALGGNINSLYSNLAAGLNSSIQNQGASQAAAIQGAGNTLGQLGTFLAR